MSHDKRIDYIEFPATDIERTKRFYAEAFGWKFTDYGPDYTSFTDGRLNGGFTTAGKVIRGGGALIVIAADDLADAENRVQAAGGTITTSAFSFPGGRRFHFTDPSGNELSVWTQE
jgi:predicted enzyme related to lactoylglutathione lyase